MTKRYADTHWRGALYNTLRSAPDGVAGFCAWAAEFRERRMRRDRFGRPDPSKKPYWKHGEIMHIQRAGKVPLIIANEGPFP